MAHPELYNKQDESKKQAFLFCFTEHNTKVAHI